MSIDYGHIAIMYYRELSGLMDPYFQNFEML